MLGTRVALVMLAGGVLSYCVLIPAIHLFGPRARLSPLVAAGALPVREMSPGQVRSAFLLSNTGDGCLQKKNDNKKKKKKKKKKSCVVYCEGLIQVEVDHSAG